MSFTWRYVVRPDGSFCRVGNLDCSLGNVSDEELARLHPAGTMTSSRRGPAPAAEAPSCCTGTAR
ncbi:hypothetical protein OG252_00310 [Streptomyces sp. NBC_01352]|uniref:hypothetical protein n=1 Tax=Streptomyces sp. NBC_01352 TaxID=2903834 RepID=UPI002E36EA7A|nr:hypothetical protein [Streptomyces sp. NBC_01352]